MDGTENQWVSSASAAHRTGASRSRRVGTTRVAPLPQAANRSNTDRSKVRSKVCDSRLPGPSSYRATTCSR